MTQSPAVQLEERVLSVEIRLPASKPQKLRMLAALLAGATFAALAAPSRAAAAELFVSPKGSDSNPGTIEQPFASLQKGHDVATAGDTVWLRGGSYAISKQVQISKSGQSEAKRIRFWAYQNETPLLDCSTYRSTNANADVPAIVITGSWLHLRGLEIANVPAGASGTHSISALRSTGASNNIYELLNIHHNFGPGL